MGSIVFCRHFLEVSLAYMPVDHVQQLIQTKNHSRLLTFCSFPFPSPNASGFQSDVLEEAKQPETVVSSLLSACAVRQRHVFLILPICRSCPSCSSFWEGWRCSNTPNGSNERAAFVATSAEGVAHAVCPTLQSSRKMPPRSPCT